VKVSLIATVLNAGDRLEGFLASVSRQTRPPDEVVVVDGGSTDRTLEALREAAGITLLEEPGANVARGRNVNHRFRELGLDMRLAKDAIVDRPLRDPLGATWWRYFSHARGDAIAGMYPERHAVRLGAYSGALWAWSTRGTVRKLATIAGAASYASTPLRRVATRFEDPAERAKAMLTVPALIALVDAAKIAGYLAGLPRRRQPS